jgi:glycosyltransferase involved in cell wall biosynthesis
MGTRLGCIEGESIEADSWYDLLSHLGYELHMLAGTFCTKREVKCKESPLLDHKHPEIRAVKRILFGSPLDKAGKKTAKILLDNTVTRLKGDVKKFFQHEKFDLIIVINIFSDLKNPVASVVMRELAKELSVPMISYERTFVWDNDYYTKHNNFPNLTDEIPPTLKHITHVVNTTQKAKELQEHKNITPKVIPKFLNLEKLQQEDAQTRRFRTVFEIPDDAYIFLQPTRLSRKKGVEHALKIVAGVNKATKKENVLILTGPPRYFRGSYFEEIVKRMQKMKVRVIFAHDKIGLSRESSMFSMGDAYLNCDMVLFPATQHAFGRPVLEAFAYKKPIVVVKQSYYDDLKQFDPQMIEIEKVDEQVISDVMETLLLDEKREEMVKKNFAILKEHYSQEAVSENIITLLNELERKPFFTRMKKRFIG